MLIAVRLRIPRPAALKRRRSFLFAALAALIAVPLVAGARDSGRPGDDVAALAAARRSATGAVRALRADSPGAARYLDRLIADAEVATAQELTAAGWRRTPGRVEISWSRVLVAAHDALAKERRRELGFEERWAEVRDQVATDVRLALEQSQEAGVGRREIAAAQQASLKWTLAEQWAEQGDLERALGEAAEAQEFTEVVERSFTALHQRFEDPKERARWQRLVRETVELSRSQGSTVIVVDKLKRRLVVYARGQAVATYRAELGAKGLRRKLHSGDQATPEGRYRVTEVRGPGRTSFYKALMLDYPNAEDRARYEHGRRTGQVPLRAGIGSLIEIHGEGGQGRDWTNGCVALSNRDMDEVFARARVGTPVTIVGTY